MQSLTALQAPEILFSCLNGDVPEEKLDLFDFTAGGVAKACASAAKIMGANPEISRSL